jgi:hypothetical protein
MNYGNVVNRHLQFNSNSWGLYYVMVNALNGNGKSMPINEKPSKTNERIMHIGWHFC